MSRKVDEIEGVGPAYAEKLGAAGVHTTDDLLEKACTAKGRAALEGATGITTTLLLKWANHCDLMRIKGVGPQFSELLECAGVDTVKELARRRADNLTAKLNEVNAAKNLTNGQIGEGQVQGWIDQAGELDAIITH